MSMNNELLTVETLMKDERFTSQFDLVNYAIGVAVDHIKSGHPPRVKTDVNNTAYQTLLEISIGKDKFEKPETEQKAI